jgi:type IV pilus assembly protein PilM
MPDKPNAMQTLGLELNSQTIKGAKLSLRKGKPALDKVFELPFDFSKSSPDAVQSLYKTPEGQAFQGYTEKDLIVTGLSSSEVLVRQAEVKLKKEADIDSVLAFQAEPLLPYPIENAVVDRIKVSETADGSQLTIIAARKDHVQQHLDLCHSLHLEPEVVSCLPAALAAFAGVFAQTTTPQIVIHLGHANTLCILTSQGKLIAAQSCSNGIDHLIKAFEKDKNNSPSFAGDLRNLNFDEISKEHLPELASALDQLRLDVTRTLYALSKNVKGQDVTQILVTGEGAALNNLPGNLCKSFNKTLVVPAVDPQFNLNTQELQKFALPIGLALTALTSYKDEINFRQNDFAYPNPWRRYKQPLGIFLGLCLLLALAFYFFGNAYVKYREDQLRKEYSEMLLFMHKPYNEFENEFEEKTGAKNKTEQSQVTQIQDISEDGLVNRIQFLDKDLQSAPYYYPLLPNVPTVSDVLAWLATHPNVVMKDTKTNALTPLLEIESFNYSLVKRPDQTKKQEKYQVKVEIEFSSPTPKLAREFHDALIAPNAIVDPKGEVKWSTNRGLYRASFYLKDKTVYPSSS